MRIIRLVVACLLLTGCALEVPVADYLTPCLPEDKGQPDCNGERQQVECEAAGLPSAYGVDTGCQHPVKPVGAVNKCERRPAALVGCVATGKLTCCPE